MGLRAGFWCGARALGGGPRAGLGLSPCGLRVLVLRAGFGGCQAPSGAGAGAGVQERKKEKRKKKKTCIGRCLF